MEGRERVERERAKEGGFGRVNGDKYIQAVERDRERGKRDKEGRGGGGGQKEGERKREERKLAVCTHQNAMA